MAGPGRGARFRPPRRDRGVREPDGQATAPSERRVVFPPVRDPIATLRNVVAMLGVVFKRHGGSPDTEWDHPALTGSGRQPRRGSMQHRHVDALPQPLAIACPEVEVAATGCLSLLSDGSPASRIFPHADTSGQKRTAPAGPVQARLRDLTVILRYGQRLVLPPYSR
jgi:hypothetical protein